MSYTTIHIKKLIKNSKLKIKNSRKGFSLIELLVAMFIFAMVMGGMVAVSVAGFRSYGKSKAIKTVTEDVGFAINSITKDVRMGKIENNTTGCGASSPQKCLMVTRNATQEKVCYIIDTTTNQYLAVSKTTLGALITSCPAYDATIYNNIVDLSASSMTFDATSGFYSMPTDTTSATKIRGWAEINLNIENPTMDTDSIHMQTTVSSRDYGWENL